jgi:hypothetical protein
MDSIPTMSAPADEIIENPEGKQFFFEKKNQKTYIC